MGTDRDWEKWGASDPYYGVYSLDKFRINNLSEQSRDEFFRSGEEHIKGVFDTIWRVFEKDFTPRRSLDFGCGVGRLVLPLAQRSGHVLGVDISPSMLAEAQKNCTKLQNCSFALTDGKLSEAIGTFDLVHSFIVFQHIPQDRGQRIIVDRR
jgi:2-polyprenyl-3-methyl-5-hydroxy-6-metoxy-1,4-benzoquinol methylase